MSWPHGRKARNAGRKITYCIEGEYVTLAQLATRIGVSEVAAQSRLQRCKVLAGPITWKKLNEAGRK